MDIVDKLLAAVGESTLLVSLMRLGILQHIEGMEIPKVAIRTDENHLAVVTVGIGEKEFPQRLVLDPDFGWLWYNAVDGPVEILS
jgi:hypothetical protein